MYKVKVSICDDATQFIRQTPGNNGFWRNYRFYVNDDIKEADFWVIVSKGRRKDETCNIAPENTIFINGEPDSVYHYADNFIKQFGIVIAPTAKIKHNKIIKGQAGLLWYLGVCFNNDGTRSIDSSKNYDYYKTNVQHKEKLISVISSNLAITEGHVERIEFIKKLKEHYGDKLDLFGRGFNNIEDKWNAIAPYKYHIVIENSSYPNYWTEKIADPILVNSYPIYYGCTNLNDYFPKNSFTYIDIKNPNEAIKIIDETIQKDYAIKYSKEMADAKELLLDKHNICNIIADLCDNLNPSLEKTNYTIKNELSYLNTNKIKMMLSRTYYKLKSLIFQ